MGDQLKDRKKKGFCMGSEPILKKIWISFSFWYRIYANYLLFVCESNIPDEELLTVLESLNKSEASVVQLFPYQPILIIDVYICVYICVFVSIMSILDGGSFTCSHRYL